MSRCRRVGTRRLCRLLPIVLLAWATAASTQPSPDAEPKQNPPKEHAYSYLYDMLDNSLARPATRFFDPALLVRKITKNPREAVNVDRDDQVRLPSTWWQPRLGFRDVSVEQMLHGPGPGEGPAAGKWTVTKAKTQGVTPGFQIKDAKGVKYIIKFDPAQYPELASGADVIGSYIFWAAGYNVPENTIAYFGIDDLTIDDKATYKDMIGRERPLTPEFLKQVLGGVAKMKDGRYRCLASKFLEGKPLGPAKYAGRRSDDPEDRVPHELRRELRGMWTVCAFMGHGDSRGPNTLDTWVKGNDRSFVRHHLIDFGSTLGSSALGARDPASGTQYYVDYLVMGQQFATLGLHRFAWEDMVDPNIPAVGFFESREFDPVGWRPDYPNPAFDERTTRDIRWGARIVAAFTDEHIRAAVEMARFTDPRATEYLTRTLIERRDKIVEHWLGTQYRPVYSAE